MSIWYAIWDSLPFEMLHWDFMKNALLALLLMAPLFGILSTMIVTGRMSFFSDALGHSAFTGIAIGIICGVAAPIWAAVAFSVVFALLFSFVRSRSNQAADTLIGVFSSSAVALGIFVATVGGGSFTRYNKYLIGDILSVTPGEIGMLALVLLAVIVFWIFYSNRLTLTAIHPQLASSRGIPVGLSQTLFTAAIAVVVTLSISSVGLLILNSLLVLPGDTYACRQPDPVLQQVEHTNSLATTTNDAFKAVCRYWDRVVRPEQLMSAMINAFRVLTDPANTGAVCVAMPQDVEGEAYDYPVSFFAKRVWRLERRPATEAALADAAEAIRKAKRPMMICGGGGRSPFWRQMLADMYGCSVSTVQSDQGGALGAAILAGVGAGIYSDLETACDALVRKKDSSEPNMAANGAYAKYFTLYKELYRTLFQSFKDLKNI